MSTCYVGKTLAVGGNVTENCVSSHNRSSYIFFQLFTLNAKFIFFCLGNIPSVTCASFRSVQGTLRYLPNNIILYFTPIELKR